MVFMSGVQAWGVLGWAIKLNLSHPTIKGLSFFSKNVVFFLSSYLNTLAFVIQLQK